MEEGEIVARGGPLVPGGTLILTSGLRAGGSLGVNIQYQGVYRLLSCAHVLTAFDPNFVGKTINYCEAGWQNPQPLTTVTGMVPVTVYPTSDPPNPVRNVQDLAWANITPQLGSPAIDNIGTPSGIRAPKTEQVQVYGGVSNSEVQTTKILSLTARTTVRSLSSDGSTYVYTFWQSVMQLDAGSISHFPGDSGSAVVATADRAVVGLAFSIGSINVYACPIVT